MAGLDPGPLCHVFGRGEDNEFAIHLGGKDGFMEKVGQYFGGTMMEARRLLEPVVDDDDDEASDGRSGDS